MGLDFNDILFMIQTDDFSALDAAIETYGKDVINQKGIDNSTVLFFARSATMVKKLIALGLDANHLNDDLENALFHARNTEVIQTLLDSGIRTDIFRYDGDSPSGYLKGFDETLYLGIYIEEHSKTPCFSKFESLVQSGNIKHIQDEIRKNPPILNLRDGRNMTLLFYAETDDMVYALVNAGLDINAKNEFGQNALHITPNINSARALIELGININQRDNDNSTPEQWQRECSNYEVSDFIKSYTKELTMKKNDKHINDHRMGFF